MKKRIILVVLPMLLLAVSAQAQVGGLKIGGTLSNLYIDDVDDENSKLGFTAGIFGRTSFAEPIGLRYELLYSSKGAEVTYNNFIQGSGKYKFNLNYIKLPVMFSVKAGPVDFHAGPYFGYLIGANVKDVDSDGTINEVEQLDRDDFNTLDYGAAFGLAFGFAGGEIGARYNYGMRNIGEEGSFAGEAASDAKNQTFTISLGLKFNE
ncbi:porin family protein [Roseivirga pacifica]